MKPRSAVENWKQHHPNHLPTYYQSKGTAGNPVGLPAETTAITATPVTTNPRANGRVASCFLHAMNPSFIKTLGTVSAIGLVLGVGVVFGTENAEDLIAKGDLYYAKLQASEALKYYLPAEKLDPNNAHLLVHISREYRHMMSDATAAGEKVKLGQTALSYAKRAVAINPNDPEAQLALAISCGKLEPFGTNRQKFDSIGIIKTATDKVVRLDPSNDLAWHILGLWHENLAEVNPVQRAMAQVAFGILPNSTYEQAAQCFQKAITLDPNRLMHYIELGRLYAKMGRNDEARRLINTGLGMQNTEKDDPETKRQGKELLAKLP
jgi:tetratricopeptide (TPR) repeat protein